MYRKQLEEEARLEAELKAMKKKAKKKMIIHIHIYFLL